MLMTDVEGLYTGPPCDPKSNIIPTYCPEVHDELIEFGVKSNGGRGGMLAKVPPPPPHTHTPHTPGHPFSKPFVRSLWLDCV